MDQRQQRLGEPLTTLHRAARPGAQRSKACLSGEGSDMSRDRSRIVAACLEEYMDEEFGGRQVMLVASYEAAFELAAAHQHNFGVVVAFNCRTGQALPNSSGPQVTHWCVNLGCRCRAVPRGVPVMTPYHEKWGKLGRVSSDN